MVQLPIIAVPTKGLQYMMKILRAVANDDLDHARHLAESMHPYLHPHLQQNIAYLAILWVIRIEFAASHGKGKKLCLCCLTQVILKAAHLGGGTYCCAPGHLITELCTPCQCKKTVERLQAKAEAIVAAELRCLRRVRAYDDSDASDESQGGRVHRRRGAAARTPYTRPPAPRVPPRMEYDHMLPPRIVPRRFPEIDALTDAITVRDSFSMAREEVELEQLTASFGSSQPFAAPPAPVPDVEAITARMNTYSPFAAEQVPVPTAAPAAAAVVPEYSMADLIEDFGGQRIPADEPVRGGDDVDLSAVIGKFARHTLNARPAPRRPRRAGSPY